jgi:hypothetical protein
MDGAVLSLLQYPDSVDYRPGFLGGGSVIEIDQGFVVNLLLQYGEIIPDLFYIEAHGFLY